ALYRTRSGRRAPAWSDDAMRVLARYRWPGNVRELANIVERLAILHGGEEVDAWHVHEVLAIDEPTSMPMHAAPSPAAGGGEPSLTEALDDYERTLISRALVAASGNVAE